MSPSRCAPPSIPIPIAETFFKIRKPVVDELIAYFRRSPLFHSSKGGHSETQLKYFIQDPIEAMIEYLFLMPASEGSHDASPGGLIDHTLQTCLRALQLADQANPPLSHADRVALFYFTLFHDAGRIFQAAVFETEHPENVWDPELCSMYEWIYGCNRKTVYRNALQTERITITWFPDRPTKGTRGSEGTGAYFFRFMPREYLKKIGGQSGFNRLLSMYCRSVGSEIPQWHALFYRADCTVARGGATVTAFFLANLRTIIREEAAAVNVPNADAFISATHTLLCLPSQECDGCIWRRAEQVLDEHDVSPSSPNESKADAILRLHDLPIERWERAIDRLHTPRTSFKLRVIRPDGKVVTAVAISNASLWGGKLTADWLMPFTGSLSIRHGDGGDIPMEGTTILGFTYAKIVRPGRKGDPVRQLEQSQRTRIDRFRTWYGRTPNPDQAIISRLESYTFAPEDIDRVLDAIDVLISGSL